MNCKARKWKLRTSRESWVRAVWFVATKVLQMTLPVTGYKTPWPRCLTPSSYSLGHLHVRASGKDPRGQRSWSVAEFCTAMPRPSFLTPSWCARLLVKEDWSKQDPFFSPLGEGWRERTTGCLSQASNWEPGPQPRPVPWLGIKPATLWFPGLRSVHWATPARAEAAFFQWNPL